MAHLPAIIQSSLLQLNMSIGWKLAGLSLLFQPVVLGKAKRETFRLEGSLRRSDSWLMTLHKMTKHRCVVASAAHCLPMGN